MKYAESSEKAPLTFAYVEKLLRTKNFGVLTTITPVGKPHSVGVVYAVSPPSEPFCIYLMSRVALKKARNINNDLMFRLLYRSHIISLELSLLHAFSFREKEFIPIDNPDAVKSIDLSSLL